MECNDCLKNQNSDGVMIGIKLAATHYIALHAHFGRRFRAALHYMSERISLTHIIA